MKAQMESETKPPDQSQPDQSKKAKQPKQSLTAVRLRKHADFQRAYADSRKRQSASMSWFLAPGEARDQRSGIRDQGAVANARVGLTAGKVLGKAHERNLIKRRMREALRRHLDLLPEGADLILHPRRAVLTMEFAKLEAELVRILTQARADAAKAASRARMVSRP
ncbi:MAG TPA: ribonuclease P protein component [Verrucomicrobiaceae bacterium]